MKDTERQIRKGLREAKDFICLDLKSYLVTLAIALRMPIGSVKANIIKRY